MSIQKDSSIRSTTGKAARILPLRSLRADARRHERRLKRQREYRKRPYVRKRLIAQQRKYYRTHRDHLIALQTAWKKRNPERVRQYNRKYAVKYAVKILAKNKRYREINREKINSRYHSKYRTRAITRQKSQTANLSDVYIKRILRMRGPLPKELIFLKRTQLQLFRTIRNLNKEQPNERTGQINEPNAQLAGRTNGTTQAGKQTEH